MNSNKRTARVVGALFLVALVASIVGGSVIEPILTGPDYLASVSEDGTQVKVGVLLELINGVAVIVIGVMLFPIFKEHDEAAALGYVAFRVVEAVIIIIAVISPLALVALSQQYVQAGSPDTSSYEALGATLQATRSMWVGQMLGVFFGLVGLVLYYLLYRSKLVPRFISVWGLIAVALIVAWNLLEFFGITVSFGMALALPMILNEVFLALWLIVRGFNPSAIASGSAK
jgi:hypothetical protein